MGVSRLMFLIGIVLVVTALVGIAFSRKGASRLAVIIIVPVIAAAALWAAPVQQADPDAGLISIEHSAYAEIRVVDRNGVRFMLIDGGTHTIVDAETFESRFPYVDVLDITKGFYDRPGDMLLVGLGGGSVVKRFARDGWRVDAVEIDPVVTRVAYEYFGLEPTEANVYHMDGRQFLIAIDRTYDLIVMDVFGSSSIPFHLVTREAFALIAARLEPGGVLAINTESIGWHDMIVRSLAATLKEEFAQVLLMGPRDPRVEEN